MRKQISYMKVVVIIPAFNEEKAIGKVLNSIPNDLVEEVVVVDNNSTDQTGVEVKKAGATLLHEKRKGYGYACLKGIDYFEKKELKPDVVVFIDADHSDYPEEMSSLLAPIQNESMDLVIGSRALGNRERGSMTIPQIFGNWLATGMLKLFYKVTFTDLGPFRAIRWESLMQLGMRDKTFGWTVEMQVKAAKMNMKCTEVPVNYRRRIGKSKVSGTVKGTIMAGYKIIWTILKNL